MSSNENPEWYSYCCSDLSKAVPPGGLLDGMKAVLAKAGLMRDNGKIITVGFVPPVPGTAVQQAKVQEVIKERERHANLKFRFISNGDDAEIRVSFQSNNGSWSYVGNTALKIQKPKATMNFGWVYATA